MPNPARPPKASRTAKPSIPLAEAARRLVEGLNAEQRVAALAPPGPVLVVAGAGSGKTRVLVTRIVHLLHLGPRGGGAEPDGIVALTFSNRSAREMRARLKAYAGKAGDGVFPGTFHSLGLRMVRENAEALGLAPNPSVLDVHGRLSLIAAQAARHGSRNQKFDLLDLAAVLSRVKEDGATPESCPDDTEYGPRLAKIYKGYEKAKRQANLLDFEDLIRMPIALLGGEAQARAAYRARWRHFLVDEFQDTNKAQLDLLRLLVGGDTPGPAAPAVSAAARGVFVVGDDDQSIYAWRGAEMRNLLDFEAHFPGATVVKLQQNYRSTGHIIGASNAVIHRNLLRRPKTVFTSRDEGEPLNHHVADDEKSEVDWLVAKVKELRQAEALDYRDMALLVRTNIQLREWMEAFIMNGVPFSVKGASNLLEFPEVQAVLAYAKLIANPHDELSLAKVLAFPKRGWPKGLLDETPRSETLSTLACLRARCAEIGNAWSAEVGALCERVEAAHAEAEKGGVHAPLEALLEAAGVLAAFEEGSRKRGRVQEFLDLLRKEEERRPEASLADMLNVMALDTAAEDTEDKPGLRLMTVHASKGLEFHTVFLPTLDDDVFPSKPNHTDAGIEEERRLFYVALTRAKRRLFLSWPATKIHYRVVRDVVPCRFLHEIPETHWDGPLGKKDEEEKKAFIEDFFATLKADMAKESPP